MNAAQASLSQVGETRQEGLQAGVEGCGVLSDGADIVHVGRMTSRLPLRNPGARTGVQEALPTVRRNEMREESK